MKKQMIALGTSLLLVILLIGACSTSMTDDERAIAIAIALTQTAAAPAATVPVAEATIAPATEITATVATTPTTIGNDPPALPNPPAVSDTPVAAPTTAQAAAAPTAVVQTVAPGSTEPLPITQPAAKVRTLLVAPGEPGALYALLTDQIDDNAPIANAQFLISRDFGVSWAPAPSGLPTVDADCLYNMSMDYYGATALFASTCEGLYRWSEAEPTWTLLSEQPTGLVAVVYSNADLIWATRPFTPTAPPLLRSQNGGETWETVALTHTTGVANIGVNPRDSQTGYAIVWPDEEAGSDLRRGSLFAPWQIMPTPNGNQAINTGMTIDGGTGNLYVTTRSAEGAKLWRSTNPDVGNIDNVQWGEVYAALSGVNLELLSSGWSSQEDELSIYANFTQLVDDQLVYALYRSLDSGRTWAPVEIK